MAALYGVMNAAAGVEAGRGYWVHDLSPFLVRFTETIGVRYYGLAYVLAFVTAAVLLHLYWRAGRSPLNPQVQSSMLLAIIIGVMVGSRLGYFLLYYPQTLLHDPLAFFRLWEGGMASHGGFVGVCIAVVWVAWKHRLPMWQLSDVIATLAPPGFMLGRLANFINGELWGKVSYVKWAVIFPDSAPAGTPLSEIPPRHPSQLYEAALEGLLLLVIMQVRFWKSDVTRKYPGSLAGEFLVLYAVFRVIGELFREPDAPLLFGLSRGIFYSFFLIIGGMVIIITSRRRRKA
jgi:phosphatidylglycerol---prolipoprotein diacylglyceryl transferase